MPSLPQQSAQFKITENRWVGHGHPIFIIAEVGNNHQGKIELALECIDNAAKAKADAVTFQYAPIQTLCVKEMYDDPGVAFLKECEFSLDQLKQLRDRARKHGLAFSINVEDNETLDTVLGIGMDFIKLCSPDLTNIPYIQYAASKGLPIFFSTGGAYLGEIETAFAAMVGAGLKDFVVYHTNSGYPTPIAEANLLQMDLLHEVFGGVKGYCDHTCDIIPPVVAASRGAKVIEKHITTNRALRGDDWMVSLEPAEFETMVTYVRQAEAALGTRMKKPLLSEMRTRTFKRKSVVSRTALKAGTTLKPEHFSYKSPGTGLSPADLDKIVGKKLRADVPEDVLITPEMIEGIR
jgi:sialic acid synthase SpsE